jgi:hypothetical protein
MSIQTGDEFDSSLVATSVFGNVASQTKLQQQPDSNIDVNDKLDVSSHSTIVNGQKEKKDENMVHENNESNHVNGTNGVDTNEVHLNGKGDKSTVEHVPASSPIKFESEKTTTNVNSTVVVADSNVESNENESNTNISAELVATVSTSTVDTHVVTEPETIVSTSADNGNHDLLATPTIDSTSTVDTTKTTDIVATVESTDEKTSLTANETETLVSAESTTAERRNKVNHVNKDITHVYCCCFRCCCCCCCCLFIFRVKF